MFCALDLEAAFDKINRQCFNNEQLLVKLNVGNKMTQIMKTIADNMYSCVS